VSGDRNFSVVDYAGNNVSALHMLPIPCYFNLYSDLIRKRQGG
jgi:hypothetical protein